MLHKVFQKFKYTQKENVKVMVSHSHQQYMKMPPFLHFANMKRKTLQIFANMIISSISEFISISLINTSVNIFIYSHSYPIGLFKLWTWSIFYF